MRKVAFQVAPQARDVAQISGLAVALGKPGEDAEDLGVALGAERGISEREGVAVEVRLARGCTASQ